QLQLPSRRTVLLDSSLDDPNAFIPWLRNLGTSAPPLGVVPLSQVLEWTKPRRLASLGELQDKSSLYAKIGTQDALAFPDLLAGSIVRVRPVRTGDMVGRASGEGSKNLFLVEHGKGLCCCQIRTVAGGRIATISAQLPYAQVEFKVPEEARIVGVLDLEILSLLRPQQPTIAKELARRWKPEVLSPEPAQLGAQL